MRNLRLILSIAVFLPLVGQAEPPPAPGPIQWQGWSDQLFDQAKKEHKFVLLDLEAIWCHWCHVMDETTYKDADIKNLMGSRYIAVRVDQDSRPDLSNRYEDYGWPATVVFTPDGKEIVKRAGYIPPDEMKGMLEAIIKDPTPGPSIAQEKPLEIPSSPFLSDDLRKRLSQSYLDNYDADEGSWGTVQKFLDWDSVEYAMALARSGDSQAEKMARQTLKAQMALIDPVWGGVYQYSTDGDWKHPHFEKIMQMQAENLKVYALAYAQWKDPEYLHSAQSIAGFLKNFLLSPDGAFYTSEDADLVQGEHSADYFALDDTGRRKRGVPRIDQHIYSRENGWAIYGLTTLYMATKDEPTLRMAEKAAEWIIQERALPGGGFRHDAKDPAGPYLGDTLAMGRAFLNLYTATADERWLNLAEGAADYISQNFPSRTPQGVAAGFRTAKASESGSYQPTPERDENVSLARFANLLFQYTGRPQDRQTAEGAMRFLAIPEIARRLQTAGVLLADRELGAPPAHLTVVGRKNASEARMLFLTALGYPSAYKRIDWWDPRRKPLPNTDVEYPKLAKPAAFLCANGRCSLPIFDVEKLRSKIDSPIRKI